MDIDCCVLKALILICSCLAVHSSVHACAGAGGGVPFPDWLWTLFLFLAQRRLWTVQSVPGEGTAGYNLTSSTLCRVDSKKYSYLV